MENLSDSFALQTSHHLRKLRVRHLVSLLDTSNVQRAPFRIPVSGYSVGAFVLVVDFLEGLDVD